MHSVETGAIPDATLVVPPSQIPLMKISLRQNRAKQGGFRLFLWHFAAACTHSNTTRRGRTSVGSIDVSLLSDLGAHSLGGRKTRKRDSGGRWPCESLGSIPCLL